MNIPRKPVRTLKSPSITGGRRRRTSALVALDRQQSSESRAIRQEGRLTPVEIEEMRIAYLAGARGELLIGLRKATRLLTLNLPPLPNREVSASRMERNAERLRSIGADGYIYARRAKLRSGTERAESVLVIDEDVERQETQNIIWLRDPARRLRSCGPRIEDAINRKLRACFRGEDP